MLAEEIVGKLYRETKSCPIEMGVFDSRGNKRGNREVSMAGRSCREVLESGGGGRCWQSSKAWPRYLELIFQTKGIP